MQQLAQQPQSSQQAAALQQVIAKLQADLQSQTAQLAQSQMPMSQQAHHSSAYCSVSGNFISASASVSNASFCSLCSWSNAASFADCSGVCNSYSDFSVSPGDYSIYASGKCTDNSYFYHSAPAVPSGCCPGTHLPQAAPQTTFAVPQAINLPPVPSHLAGISVQPPAGFLRSPLLKVLLFHQRLALWLS